MTYENRYAKKLAGQFSVTGYAKECFYISIRIQILILVLASHRLQSRTKYSGQNREIHYSWTAK